MRMRVDKDHELWVVDQQHAACTAPFLNIWKMGDLWLCQMLKKSRHVGHKICAKHMKSILNRD